MTGNRSGFVLVHGGYRTARCWEKLAPHLDGDIQAIGQVRPRTLR